MPIITKNNCPACEAFQDNEVNIACPDHRVVDENDARDEYDEYEARCDEDRVDDQLNTQLEDIAER